jgi:hypothetical protein
VDVLKLLEIQTMKRRLDEMTNGLGQSLKIITFKNNNLMYYNMNKVEFPTYDKLYKEFIFDIVKNENEFTNLMK